MIPGILIGITHDKNRNLVIREPRSLRVGIGVSKGPGCYVYTHRGRWVVKYGALNGDGKPEWKTLAVATRAEAETWYKANKATFAVFKYPQKLQFFTFTRRTITDKGEQYEPDFDAIERHGDTPREIDIIFMSNDPYRGEYQAWSASEMKCHGDGENAERVIAMGNPSFPGWKEAKDSGQRYFPITDCFVSEKCPYAQDGGKDKLVCKPMSTLSFQLANDIRLGSSAYFVSTSIRSAVNLSSSINSIKVFAAQAGVGIMGRPVKLILSPFKTNHKGQSATHWAASVELRAQDTKALRALLDDSHWRSGESVRVIEDEEPLRLEAPTVTSEFFPEATVDPEDDEESAGPGSSSAQAATENKTAELAKKIEDQKAKPGTEQAVPADYPKATIETFLADLGEADFKAIIKSIIGTDDVQKISAHNHKPIWAAMEKRRAERTAALCGPQRGSQAGGGDGSQASSGSNTDSEPPKDFF